MNNSLKIASPWSQFGLLIALLGGGMIFFILIVSFFHFPKDAIDNPRLIPSLKLAQAIYSTCTFLLPALFFARMTSTGRPLSFLGFRPAQKDYFYSLGVAILLLSLPLQGMLGELNKHMPLPASALKIEEESARQIAIFLKGGSPSDIIINMLMIAVLPAICEEAFFRGALQRILIQITRSPWAGIVCSAAIFSFIHMQFLGFFPRMCMGMLLGAVYWYSGSLWVSILAHFFINGIQVSALIFYPSMVKEDPAIPVYAGIVSLIIVIALLALLHKKSTVSYAAVYEPAVN